MSRKTQFIGVVDDDFDLMSLFRDALSKIEGMDVFGFTDPTLALEHFTTNHSDYRLILSDFRIPVMNGVELLKKVKAIKPSVKTLLISAFDINDELLKDHGCVDKILQKPTKINDLIEEVRMQIN